MVLLFVVGVDGVVGHASNTHATLVLDLHTQRPHTSNGAHIPPLAQIPHGHAARPCATTIETAFHNRAAIQSGYTTSMSIPATSPNHSSAREPMQSTTDTAMFNVPTAPVLQTFAHTQITHTQTHMHHARAQGGASLGLAPFDPLPIQRQPGTNTSVKNKFCTQCGTVVR